MSEPAGLSSLPDGWIWATFGDVGEYVNGRAFKPTEWGDSGRPIIRIQNLTGSSDTVNRYAGAADEKHIVRVGDLLISWSATLGAYFWRGEEAVLNQHIFKVLPFVDKSFLYHVTTAHLDSLIRQTHGSGMQHITKGKFESSRIPLPPLPEQRRIVARLEELFSRLDAGTAALEQARAQLALYRQAVLRDAFQGKLTAAWREAHRGELEPASVLLERIRREREVAAPTRGRRKTQEPEPLDMSELPALPEGWGWVAIADVSEVVTGNTPPKSDEKNYGDHIPLVKPPQLTDGPVFEAPDALSPQGALEARVAPQGAVLVSCIGNLGKTAICGRAVAFNQQINAVIASPLMLPEYLLLYFQSFGFRQALEGVASATTISIVNKGKFSVLPVPLAPAREQAQIVSQLQRRLSLAEQVLADAEILFGGAEALRSSILQCAFEGKLLPQDPDDEPAEALLARIQQARQSDKPTRSTRRQPKQERLL